jgi:RNA polymerase sigma-70 factor (ECF subfamily)
MRSTAVDLTDQEIIIRIANKDENAFSLLLDKYEHKVYTFAFRLIKEKEIAEEITQDIFIHIWNDAHSLVKIQSRTGWLYRLAKNKSINMLKQQLARSEREISYANEQEYQVDPLHVDVFTQQQRLLDNFLTILPDKARMVFELKIHDGLSNEEIAHRLGISAHTVKNHLTQCYHRLKIHLSHCLVIILLDQCEINNLFT